MAKGGRRRSDHGDVAWRRNTDEAVRGMEALPCTASKQGGCGEAMGSRWNYGGGEGVMRVQGEAERPAMVSVVLRCGQCEGGGRQWRVTEREVVTELSHVWSPYVRTSTPQRGPNDGQWQQRGGQSLAPVGHHGATRDVHQSLTMKPNSD